MHISYSVALSSPIPRISVNATTRSTMQLILFSAGLLSPNAQQTMGKILRTRCICACDQKLGTSLTGETKANWTLWFKQIARSLRYKSQSGDLRLGTRTRSLNSIENSHTQTKRYLSHRIRLNRSIRSFEPTTN